VLCAAASLSCPEALSHRLRACAAAALRLAWPRVPREPLEAGRRLASSPRHSAVATGRRPRVPRVAGRRAPSKTDRAEGRNYGRVGVGVQRMKGIEVDAG